MSEQKSDLELVKAACGGDRDGFTELCRRYYPIMVAIAHSITGDRHLAEDAAQQTFANAVVNMGKLKKREKFGSWIGSICRNAARDMLARRSTPALDRPLDTGGDDDGDERVEAVRMALRELPEEAREVVYLKYYDGMSYERISAVLGISEQAINGRLRRARARIAEFLELRGFGEVRS